MAELAIIQIDNPNEKYDADGNDCKSPKQSLSGVSKFFLILVLARRAKLDLVHFIKCLP